MFVAEEGHFTTALRPRRANGKPHPTVAADGVVQGEHRDAQVLPTVRCGHGGIRRRRRIAAWAGVPRDGAFVEARLQTVVLAHLSGNCNTPECALDRAYRLEQGGTAVHLAPRDAPSPWIALDA